MQAAHAAAVAELKAGGLAELHTHLGGSADLAVMWALAYEQGIALPVDDYGEFDRLITIADPRGPTGCRRWTPSTGGRS
ncbi:MAG: hypothetical protein OXG37_12360 [Actinomycetia bacterium]|nr:hypothetical protein [Actinomycetes bacterium]